MAKKKNKMSTAEAVKILANDSKQTKNQLQMMYDAFSRLDGTLRDYISLFEHYMKFTKDGDDFVKHMQKLVEEKVANEQKTDEPTDEKDTVGDNQDKKVRTARIRPQQG